MITITNPSTSTSKPIKGDRCKTVEALEKNYKGQYGEFMYYAGQVFVFKEGNKANKTLLVRQNVHDDKGSGNSQNFLKSRQVYEGDSDKALKETINDWKAEWSWYNNTFSDIPSIKIPKEEYSICKDPINNSNKTVLVKTEWIENIEGDIFRLDSQKLFEYITKYPKFRKTLINLVKRLLELSEKDIYPDFTGVDNISVYLDNGTPHIALIDPHIILKGQCCNNKLMEEYNCAILKFHKFLKDPLDYKNIEFLTTDGIQS